MHFSSLPTQVADYLKVEIAQGRWVDRLPGERSLASTLHVSRRSLKVALAQLQRAGVIESEPAKGHRILAISGNAATQSVRQIGLLTPEPLDKMRPGANLWVNELQALLAEADFRLNFFHAYRYMSDRPSRALSKLVTSNPQACWLLAGSNESVQSWFERAKVPAIVVGTRHVGQSLPDVDLDFMAMGRHLGGRLAAKGHRRAAFFLTRAPGYFASELESEQGFREVLEKGGGQTIAVYHERTRDSLVRALRRLFNGSAAPTALVMINSVDYLTAVSFLAQRGLHVPQDVSVVARNDDAFMSALLPEPTRYHANLHLLAGRIFKLAMQVVDGQPPLVSSLRIMPKFIAGESVGKASLRSDASSGHD